MSASPFLPTRRPNRNLETAAFWDACAQGRLSLPKCDDCGEFIWYPRLFCPFCASTAVTYTDVSGFGAVYSFTVMRRGAGVYRDFSPYVLAYVRLDEGPVMLTNLVDLDPDSARIGLPVQVIFEPADDGSGDQVDSIPRFTPLR
jgi:uncharacterized OB-fold protein